MTVSTQVRREQHRLALSRLLDQVGDQDVRDVAISPDDHLFSDLLPTVFWQLQREMVLQQRNPDEPWRMNHDRWAGALIELREQDPEFIRRKGAFCRAVKDAITPRRAPVVIPVLEFATLAALPAGWCWNAIRGNLFCRVHDAPRYGQLRYTDDTVTLPPTWGQQP